MSATLTSSQISPSGNLLLLRFGSNVASVAAGATYSVDGGAPIPLNYPQYDAGGPPIPTGCGIRWGRRDP